MPKTSEPRRTAFAATYGMSDSARLITFVLSPALSLLAPLLLFLAANDYPLLTAEVAILFALVFVPGFAAACIDRRFGSRHALPIVWLCFSAGVAVLYSLPAVTWVLAWLLISAVFVFATRETAALLIAVAAGTHVAVTARLHLAGEAGAHVTALPPGHDRNLRAATGPPIVHLLFDELAGIHGMPSDVGAAAGVGEQLLEEFSERGFSIFPKAYSQYVQTINSLPNLVNFTSSDRFRSGAMLNRSGSTTLVNNDYFAGLREKGYRIAVYQTDYIDFCHTPAVPVDDCHTYPLFDLQSIRNADIDAWQRARFIGQSLMDASPTIRMLRLRYLKVENEMPWLPDWRAGNSKTGPLSLRETLSALSHRLRTIDDGELVFAHLMIPHFPYVHHSDCSVRPQVTDWLNRVPFEVVDKLDEAGAGLEAQNDHASRELRYEHYLEQLACTRQIITELLESVKHSRHWDDATVIVHGDHGSRIFEHLPSIQNEPELTDTDFRDAYSAFFAARSPRMDAGVQSDALPLQILLARAHGLHEPAIVPGTVYLSSPGTDTLVGTKLRGF